MVLTISRVIIMLTSSTYRVHSKSHSHAQTKPGDFGNPKAVKERCGVMLVLNGTVQTQGTQSGSRWYTVGVYFEIHSRKPQSFLGSDPRLVAPAALCRINGPGEGAPRRISGTGPGGRDFSGTDRGDSSAGTAHCLWILLSLYIFSFFFFPPNSPPFYSRLQRSRVNRGRAT